MPGKIFVNYRRDDERAMAARVRDWLAQAFGGANVFMDVDNLMAGQRFDRELEKALAQTDVFLAVMGPRWMELFSGRRNSGERDYVHEEIVAALKRGIIVIPILIERAPLPRADALPEDIRELVLHQKHDVSHDQFGRDVAALVDAIRFARKSMRPSMAMPKVRAGSLGLVVAGGLAGAAAAYSGAYYSGVPLPWPWSSSLQQVGNAAAIDTERTARGVTDAEARRQADLAATAQREFELRQTRESEAKRKADAAERDRLSAAKSEQDKKVQAASEARSRAADVAAPAGYPSRPITMVVPFATGGSSDVLVRLVAGALSQSLKQQIVIENVPGAVGNIGTERAAKAANDGYHFLVASTFLALAPGLSKSLRFDPRSSFEPVGLLGYSPFILSGRVSLPAHAMGDLLTWVRTKRGVATIGNGGVGTGSWICGLQFSQAADASLIAIPYRATSAAMQDLVGGHIDLLCDVESTIASQIGTQNIRAFASTGRQRSSRFPSIPTFAEAGLGQVSSVSWTGLFAPKGTHKGIIAAMNAALVKAHGDRSVVASMERMGVIVPSSGEVSPESLQRRLNDDINEYGRLIKESGYVPQ